MCLTETKMLSPRTVPLVNPEGKGFSSWLTLMLL